MVEEERRRDGKTLRASMTGTVDHELLRRNAYDELSLIQLTMPPVAIECVRNIRREALASFWEACHVAKQNVTNRGALPSEIPSSDVALRELEEFLRQNQQDPGPNSGSDDPSDSA